MQLYGLSAMYLMQIAKHVIVQRVPPIEIRVGVPLIEAPQPATVTALKPAPQS